MIHKNFSTLFNISDQSHRKRFSVWFLHKMRTIKFSGEDQRCGLSCRKHLLILQRTRVQFAPPLSITPLQGIHRPLLASRGNYIQLYTLTHTDTRAYIITKNKMKMEVVAYTVNTCTQESEAGCYLRVCGQLSLHIECQASQGDIVRPCLKWENKIPTSLIFFLGDKY